MVLECRSTLSQKVFTTEYTYAGPLCLWENPIYPLVEEDEHIIMRGLFIEGRIRTEVAGQ